ncbi:MAG: preprotein translocase subunit SecG [Bacteroidales bacterium]|nr:MAG: preprotein translocase subunit SecG [Bacteroidota bacterium]
MYIFISILVIIACLLVIMVVLVQNSKGGGLASNFTSAGQSMGVRKTADFLEKSTWTLGAAILLLSLAATAAIPRGEVGKESVIKSSIERAQDPNAIPVLPTQTPVEEQPDGGNE